MPASNYLKGKVIDGTVRGISFAAPATVYVSLHTADPTANATPATEISAVWYARQATAFAAQSTAGQTSNSGTVTYNGVSGSPVTATHFAVDSIEISRDRMLAKFRSRESRWNTFFAFIATFVEALLTLIMLRFIYRLPFKVWRKISGKPAVS